MSNEDKPDKKHDPKPAWYMTGPGGAKAIPVKSLRIPAGSSNIMELPGDAAAKTISDDGLTVTARGEVVEAPPNKPRKRIWFLPWLGCYAVQCYVPSGDATIGLVPNGAVVMVPREWAQWIPVE